MLKLLVFVAAVAPGAWIGWAITLDLAQPGVALGPDPGETVVRFLGEWALRMLVATLTISPLQRLFRRIQFIRVRRMLGLFTFGYVVLHFSAYFVFLAGLSLDELVGDFVERPYITLGLLALLLLIPLAVTSTRGWQRRMRRNWQRLHRLVYVIAVLAWVHLFWQTRDGFFEVAVYGSLIVLLFTERIFRARRKSLVQLRNSRSAGLS